MLSFIFFKSYKPAFKPPAEPEGRASDSEREGQLMIHGHHPPRNID